MPDMRTFDAGTVAIREDAAGDGRTISGYAYRWGTVTDAPVPEHGGGYREGFERGAFAQAIAERAGRPWPYLDTHYTRGGRPVGAVSFFEDETGLGYVGRLLNTESAREYAQAVAAGSDEVSLEVLFTGDPKDSRRKGDTITHSRVRRIGALAGVPYGAFSGATVAIREAGGREPMGENETTVAERVDVGGQPAQVFAGPIPLTVEQTTEIARRVAEDVSRAFAERAGSPAPAHPLAGFRNLGEAMVAAERGELPRNHVALALELAERALADIVTTAGANAALLTGNLTVREVAGIVSRGRPAITAFGGPAPIGEGTGLTLSWPYFDGTLTDHVGAQSAEKAEITSAAVNIKLGTEAIVTYAGGADIGYQLIRQGDPSILDIFGRIMLTAWGVVTDAAFVTELESGSVTHDLAEAITAVDFTELVSHAITTSLAVETATGQPAEFILASSTAFAAYAKLVAAASTQVVVNGNLDLRALSLNIGGLPLIHVPSLTAGKAIVSNRLAARWHEAGPFQATAEDVAKLGRNVAYWSLGAGARYIPAGIIEVYDVSP